jgi:hypothetical protein
VASPWVSLRKAEKYVATGGNEWLGGPAVRGIWPDDYTDFEACADDVLDMPQGMRSVWRNASLTIEAEWPADMAVRHEGSHLPQLRRPGNIPLTYKVKVSAAPGGEPPQEFSTPRGITVEKVRRVHRVRATVSETSRPAPWQALKRQGKDVVESLHADMALRYSEAAAGIVGWFHEGKDVLSSPYPGTRSWGSLTDWSAGLWAARCRPREDPEQGVEWVGRTSSLQLNEFARGEDRDGWTVDVVNGRIPALELAAKLSPTPQHSDMAFYLTPGCEPRRSSSLRRTGYRKMGGGSHRPVLVGRYVPHRRRAAERRLPRGPPGQRPPAGNLHPLGAQRRPPLVALTPPGGPE